MSITITDDGAGRDAGRKAEALVLQLAELLGLSPVEAISVALEEAISRRTREAPLQAAERLRQKYGISLDPAQRQPLPRAAYDALWDND